MEGSLLQEFDVLAVPEEATLGQFGDVEARQPLAEAFAEGLELGEFPLNLEIALRVKRLHSEENLAVPLNRVAHEDVLQLFLVGSHQRGVEDDAVIVAYLPTCSAIFKVSDQPLVLRGLRRPVFLAS